MCCGIGGRNLTSHIYFGVCTSPFFFSLLTCQIRTNIDSHALLLFLNTWMCGGGDVGFGIKDANLRCIFFGITLITIFWQQRVT